MSITLINVDGVFTIQATSAIVVLDANNYLNYDNTSGVLSSSTTLPVSNALFDYSTGFHTYNNENVLVNIYNFKGNTIVYSSVATVLGLFQIDAGSPEGVPFFKNLNILVEIDRTTETAYLIGDTAVDDMISFVDNCHVVSNITTATPIITGLIGTKFVNGSVTNCSTTFEAGSVQPTLLIDVGGIVGVDCAVGVALPSYVYIANCFSTILVGVDGGGIVGANAGGSASAGIINILHVYSCYSAGNMAGAGGGGIIGSNPVNVITAGVGSIVTVESCFSTGDMLATNIGGITGEDSALANVATGVSTLNIISCYSTGILFDVTCGGICGANAAISTSGVSTLNISGSYVLDGVVSAGGFATGILVGTGSTVANIASTNNSFDVIMSGDATTTGRVTMSDVQVAGVYSTSRCVFSVGEAPVLTSFLDCYNWKEDTACVDLFAPALGFCGCLLEEADGVDWPDTFPGETVIMPTVDGIIKSRTCTSTSVWENVVKTECFSSAAECNDYKGAIIALSVIVILVLLMMVVLLLAL